jgi:hypothetical protein
MLCYHVQFEFNNVYPFTRDLFIDNRKEMNRETVYQLPF